MGVGSASSSAAVGQRGRLPVTVEGVEERLVVVHGLERRVPGGGPSPFARDIPAHLMLREKGDILGTYSETLLVNEAGREMQVLKVDARPPRAPLNTADMAEWERVPYWLHWLVDADGEPDVLSRKLVWLATAHLARGEDAPKWTEIRRETGAKLTPRSLAWRYRKALAVILCRMHGVPVRFAKMVAADGIGLRAA